jgi:MFS transporter, DHA1 family, multidrug resistance protein
MAGVNFLPQALANSIWILLISRCLLGLLVGGMLPSLKVLVKKLASRIFKQKVLGFNSS